MEGSNKLTKNNIKCVIIVINIIISLSRINLSYTCINTPILVSSTQANEE
jgi:hypothetical protein